MAWVGFKVIDGYDERREDGEQLPLMGSVPLLTRLEAWWNGYDPRELHLYRQTGRQSGGLNMGEGNVAGIRNSPGLLRNRGR